MRKIKVVVLLVQQLQHGFTKNAKVSPNLTVAHIHLSSAWSSARQAVITAIVKTNTLVLFGPLLDALFSLPDTVLTSFIYLEDRIPL